MRSLHSRRSVPLPIQLRVGIRLGAPRCARPRLEYGDGLPSQPIRDRSLVVYASDASGIIRGFLHFVPTYGCPAASLAFMRRDRRTPNGLTEYMIVEAIENPRGRVVADVSLAELEH